MTDTFENSTLAWVSSETHASIDRVRESLDRFIADSSDLTPLRIAGNEVRQLASTLKMSEVVHSAEVADELERMLGFAVDSTSTSTSTKRAESLLVLIHHGLDILAQRVEQLEITGIDDQLGTISVINELRAACGDDPIDLSTVFQPDIRLPLPADIVEQPVETVDTSAERRRFQEYLLAWVNNRGTDAVRAQMVEVFINLRGGAGAPVWRQLWWLAEAFTRTRDNSRPLSDRSAVSLFRRLDQHIRRFDEAGSTADIDDDLVVNLMFAVLLSGADSGMARQVIETYQLDEFQQPTATFGRLEESPGDSSASVAVVGVSPSVLEFLNQSRSEIDECTKLVDSMLGHEDVAAQSFVRLSNGVSELDRRRRAFESGSVGELVAELKDCVDAVTQSRMEFSQTLRLRSASGLALLGQIADQQIDVDDSEIQLSSTIKSIRQECAALREQQLARESVTSPDQESDDKPEVDTRTASTVDLSAPLSDAVVSHATTATSEISEPDVFMKVDLNAPRVKKSEPETVSQTEFETDGEVLAVARRQQVTENSSARKPPASKPPASFDDLVSPGLIRSAQAKTDIAAVSDALSNFAANKFDVDALAAVSDRMDKVVGFLDDKGHTKAGDVFDYCRRLVAGLISGRLEGRKRTIEVVGSGIDAVTRHIEVSDGDSRTLDLESLTEAERTLQHHLAVARARLVPLDTMRQNLSDYMAEWRSADSSRDDWRNYRVAIDDIIAFAEQHRLADLQQRSANLLQVSEHHARRLSTLEDSDVQQLTRSRDSVLVALARCFNQIAGGDGQAPLVININDSSKASVAARESIDEPESQIPETSVPSTTNPECLAIIKVLTQIKSQLPDLVNTPNDHELQSELMLGLLLVREKGENNGFSALADVARVNERLLGEVASGVVPMHDGVIQFVDTACDRLEQLALFQPPTEAQADVDAWKQALASVRAGQNPATELGAEAIFIDDLLIDSTPFSVAQDDPAKSDEAEVHDEQSADESDNSRERTGDHQVDPQQADIEDNAAEREEANTESENVNVELAGAAVSGSALGASAGSAMSAGALVQQVLANSGVDLSASASARDTDNPAAQDRADIDLTTPADPLQDVQSVVGGASEKSGTSRLSAPQTQADDQTTAAAHQIESDDQLPPTVPAARRAEGENIDVLIGEAMAHTAYLGQWVEQDGSGQSVRSVGEDLAGAVNVLRAITRVIGVDSFAAMFEPLHGLIELLRKESLPVSAQERDYVSRTGELADLVLVVLADNQPLSDLQQQQLRSLTAKMDARLLELEAQVAERGSQHQEQISIKIIGEDIVTLEQLAGGLSSDQLDLDRLFRDESTELFRRIREATARWRDEKFSRDARSDLLHEFHTLKGNARTAGFPEAAALAHSLETLLGQQNPNYQGEGLHGEEVVIYLNQATAVLTEFIEQPDSERSRDALEGLKRRVDAQCFMDSEAERQSGVSSHGATDDSGTESSRLADATAPQSTVKTRDLATVATTSYAYEGFSQTQQNDTPANENDSSDDPPVQVKPDVSSQVSFAARRESERTLPTSLMAPATIVAESNTGVPSVEEEFEEFEIKSGTLVQPARDAAHATADLVEKVTDHLGDINAMSRSLSIDLTTMSELSDEFDARLARVSECLENFETSSPPGASLDQSHESMETLRTELAGLSRLRERILGVSSQLGFVVDRHDNRVSNLRQELKQLRSVAFESIAPRLRLVLRQSSSELMKETRFVLRGGEVEIDRHILESMLGSLENLLRNAVVHGIEFPQLRRRNSKATTGTVQVAVRRDDENIVIEVSDDGAGIDYPALYSSIQQTDNYVENAEIHSLDESMLTERMFDAGITTATQTTELAGRGVGLEVVRKTARLLGGDVEVRSQVGAGSSFIIRLPAQAETIKARIVDAEDLSVAFAEHHIQKTVQIRRSELANVIDESRHTFAHEDRVYPCLVLREILKLPPSESQTQSTELVTILLLNLTHGDIALQIEGTDEVAHVVRQPRRAGVRKPAMVLSTFANIEWLDLDALWNRSSVYNLSPQAQLAFHAGFDSNEDPLNKNSTATSESTHPANAADYESVSVIPDDSENQDDRLEDQQSLVLFVADKRDIAPELIASLDASQQQVKIVGHSAAALEILDAEQVSAMLVDLDLPGGDGFELVHQISEIEQYTSLPTIVVSSVDDDFRRKRLDSLKVTQIVPKPCDNEYLAELIESIQQAPSGTTVE